MVFRQNDNYENMSEKELLIKLIKDLDEVKRYVANIHVNTDTEVKETRDMVRRIESQVKETDRQVDKIERFERDMNDIKGTLRNIERKVR